MRSAFNRKLLRSAGPLQIPLLWQLPHHTVDHADPVLQLNTHDDARVMRRREKAKQNLRYSRITISHGKFGITVMFALVVRPSFGRENSSVSNT